MELHQRALNLKALSKKKSFFLFGPRSTGKTTLIEQQLQDALIFDLLDEDVYGELLRRPKLISERLDARKGSPLVVIDEIQKLPKLLDEVHRLIKSKNTRFLLTGSSARKIKRGGANLLGGRAWQAELFPLTTTEIKGFSLLQYLNRGGLPHIYSSSDYQEELRSYVNLYLREEVAAEALVRNVDQFAKVLDLVGLTNGHEINYEGLSSDSGVKAKTIDNYLQIIEDTLIGFKLPAFRKTIKRKAITRSKLYLFDIGLVNHLAQSGEIKSNSELFGRAFEHFLMLEIRAYLSYSREYVPMAYWRSVKQHEVDCILGQQLACEFKATRSVHPSHLHGLKALREEGLIKHYCVVSQDSEERVLDGIPVYPWQKFLQLLWQGKLLSTSAI